jgi:hypothetical protein
LFFCLDDEVRAEGMAANISLLEDGQTSPIKPGGIKQVRSQRIRTPMGLFQQDVRFGLRQLWKNPGFTFFAISALLLDLTLRPRSSQS